MQPMTFPAMSYFEFISKVDLFYFLDDVQISKQSFQTRNKIRVNDKDFFINIPIKNLSINQKINQTKIIDNNWKIKLKKTILQNYSKSKYLDEFIDIYEKVICKNYEFISDLNIEFTKYFLSKLGISTLTQKTSCIKVSNDRILRIKEILNQTSDLSYLCVPGSLEYMKDSILLEDKSFNIYKFIYKPMKFDTYENRLSCLHYLLTYGFKNLKNEVGEFSFIDRI